MSLSDRISVQRERKLFLTTGQVIKWQGIQRRLDLKLKRKRTFDMAISILEI